MTFLSDPFRLLPFSPYKPVATKFVHKIEVLKAEE